MTHILANPRLYQLYQELGGFFGARVKAIARHLPVPDGARIIDIGCGPGHIVRHLPASADYRGFDIDAASIEHARAKFGDRGDFTCGLFDEDSATLHGPADIVMMNGVMHHVGDAELDTLLGLIARTLKPGGALFTLDGVYRAGQGRLVRWLLDNDRGEHVRDLAGYRTLLDRHFGTVAMHLEEDLSRCPYSYAIGVARQPRTALRNAA